MQNEVTEQLSEVLLEERNLSDISGFSESRSTRQRFTSTAVPYNSAKDCTSDSCFQQAFPYPAHTLKRTPITYSWLLWENNSAKTAKSHSFGRLKHIKKGSTMDCTILITPKSVEQFLALDSSLFGNTTLLPTVFEPYSKTSAFKSTKISSVL